MSITVLDKDHHDYITGLFENAKKSINVISPFVGPIAAQLLGDSRQKGLKCSLITRFYREHFLSGVSSLKALTQLYELGVDIYAVKHLHTKLYIFDDETAVVGSANFTYGGLDKNVELSLALEDEPHVTSQLVDYYNSLYSFVYDDWAVNGELLDAERDMVERLTKNRKGSGIKFSNDYFFGANIPNVDNKTLFADADTYDPIESILDSPFEVESMAVLKFEGRSITRTKPDDKYVPNYSKSKGMYFVCSPFSPNSLTADKTIFLCAVSWDNAGNSSPIIVGRAKTFGSKVNQKCDEEMLLEFPWTQEFPYYIEIYDIEAIDSIISDGISLLSLINDLGADLYPSTWNKDTSIQKLRNMHYRKSYIHITPKAEARINNLLDELLFKFGKQIIMKS